MLVPIEPPAPPRLSTMIGSPSCLESGSCNMRAMTSVPPPGGYGTMKVMGLAGHCAEAGDAASASARPIKNARSVMRVSLHCCRGNAHFTGLVQELTVLVHDREVHET